MFTQQRLVRSLIPLALFGICGCSQGSDNPATVPVSGTVLHNDSPVVGATVMFFAKDAPRPASGVTNDKGEFQLSMFGENDGAIAGENAITVSKFEATGAAPASGGDAKKLTTDPQAMLKSYQAQTKDGKVSEKPKSGLPEKYAKTDTSGLKETVSAQGPNKFVLKLTD